MKVVISIIVPVYNVEEYLTRCIESILNSTFKMIEIILVDDKSTDSSGKICDEFLKKDSRIQVIHKEKREGTAQARETGVKMAIGDYIAYIDSDDWIETDMLAILYNIIKKYHADMACCGFFYNYDNHEEKICQMRNTKNLKQINTYNKLEALKKMHTSEDVFGGLCNKLYSRQVLYTHGFKEEIVKGEDYTVLIGMIEKSKKIVTVAQPLYHYFQRRNSVTHYGYTEKHKDSLVNFRVQSQRLGNKYPEIKKEVINYYCVEEMVMIADMIKNENYDKKLINDIVRNIRKNLFIFLTTRGNENYCKIASILLAIDSRLFIWVYKIINK